MRPSHKVLRQPEIASAITHAFAPLPIGENPLDTERLWLKCTTQSRDYGRKGAVMAISGIDIALWDIAGKFYNQPISQLLGGACCLSVQPYARQVSID